VFSRPVTKRNEKRACVAIQSVYQDRLGTNTDATSLQDEANTHRDRGFSCEVFLTGLLSPNSVLTIASPPSCPEYSSTANASVNKSATVRKKFRLASQVSLPRVRHTTGKVGRPFSAPGFVRSYLGSMPDAATAREHLVFEMIQQGGILQLRG